MSNPTRIAVGANAVIISSDEITEGVIADFAAKSNRIDFTSEDLKAEPTLTESASIRSGRRRAKSIVTATKVSGSINSEFSILGYGNLIRHSLGTSAQIIGSDGAHGRASYGTVDGGFGPHFTDRIDTTSDNYAEFADDSIVGFSKTGGHFYVMYQDYDYSLVVDTNGGVGYLYTEFAECGMTTVNGTGVTLESGTSALPVVDSSVFNSLNGTTSAANGVIYLEIGDHVHRLTYDHVDTTSHVLTITSIDGADIAAASTSLVVPPYTIVRSYASICTASAGGTDKIAGGHNIAKYNGALAGTDLPSGTWFLNVWVAPTGLSFTDLVTNYFQIHKNLPVGLSINVFRDAASFVYVGNKVNEWSFTHDQGALATQTHAFMGMEEFVHARLTRPLLEGNTSVYVDRDPQLFMPTAGLMTVGNRTDIPYNGFSHTAGTSEWQILFALLPVPYIATADDVAVIGTGVAAVVPMVSPVPPIKSNSRLSQFEGAVFVDCVENEVLAFNFTVNNNIADDKLGFGKKGPLALVEGRSTVDLTLTVEFDDVELYKRFIDGDAASVEVRYESEDPEFIVDGVEYPTRAAFFFPRVTFTGTTPNIDDDSYVSHDMPAQAFEDNRFLAVTSPLCVFITGKTTLFQEDV